MHLLTMCMLILVASGIVLVGITHIEVLDCRKPTLDQLLHESILAEAPFLIDAQNNPDAVREVMNNLHSLFMFKLKSFSSCDTRSHHMSSLLMSFAIANTLGDDRVDDNDLAFKVVYVSLGSTAFLLIVSLLTRESERCLDAIFASNKRNDANIRSESLKQTSDLSEEYFLAHLQRKRTARVQAENQAFGGNKLELYEEESRSIRHTLRPAFAVLLILLLCILLGAVFLHLIIHPTNHLITDIFANFFYITTTSSPKWIYLNNPSIWRLLFLYANLFVGSVLVCAANVGIGTAFFSYLYDFVSMPSLNRHLERENCIDISDQHNATRGRCSHESMSTEVACAVPVTRGPHSTDYLRNGRDSMRTMREWRAAAVVTCSQHQTTYGC